MGRSFSFIVAPWRCVGVQHRAQQLSAEGLAPESIRGREPLHRSRPAKVSVRWCGRRTVGSRILTSYGRDCATTDREGDSGHRLAVDHRAKVAQRRHRDAGACFVGELCTGQRIQHPGRHGHLHVITERDDHAVSHITPEPTEDLYGLAVEWMVTVVNDRGRRFMGSVRMRPATRLRSISWKPAPTSVRFSCARSSESRDDAQVSGDRHDAGVRDREPRGRSCRWRTDA